MASMTFEQWMATLDNLTGRKVGLSINDLADQPFADWYEDGITPPQALRLALMEEGFFDG